MCKVYVHMTQGHEYLLYCYNNDPSRSWLFSHNGMSRSVLLLSCTPQPLLKIRVCDFIVFQRTPLYRADSVEYRAPSAGLETGSDTVPPTPAFPISPPTPYGKTHTHTSTLTCRMYIHTSKRPDIDQLMSACRGSFKRNVAWNCNEAFRCGAVTQPQQIAATRCLQIYTELFTPSKPHAPLLLAGNETSC